MPWLLLFPFIRITSNYILLIIIRFSLSYCIYYQDILRYVHAIWIYSHENKTLHLNLRCKAALTFENSFFSCGQKCPTCDVTRSLKGGGVKITL